jgi:hydroxypyruvate isomerase
MPQFAANETTPFLEQAFDCFGAANEAGSQGVEYLLSFDFGKESPATRLTASRICGWQTIPGRKGPGSREINSGFVFAQFDQLG